MFACQLTVVSHSALVEDLKSLLMVILGGYAIAACEAALAELVENILQFNSIAA